MIYTNLSFKPTGERTFTVDNGEKNGNRKVYLYSSLEAYNQLPDNPVKYDATSTYYPTFTE